MARRASNDPRPEYRGIYEHTPDLPAFRRLSSEGRLLWYTLRLRLGPIGLEALRAAEAALCEDTALSLAGLVAGRRELEREGLLVVDGHLWWLVQGLEDNPGLSVNDAKHRIHVRRRLAAMPPVALVGRFADRYQAWWQDDGAGLTELRARIQRTESGGIDGPSRAPLSAGEAPSRAPLSLEEGPSGGPRSTQTQTQTQPQRTDSPPAGGQWDRLLAVHGGAVETPVLDAHLSAEAREQVATFAFCHPRPRAFLAMLRSLGPGGISELPGGPSWEELSRAVLLYAGSEYSGAPGDAALLAFVRTDRAARGKLAGVGVPRETGPAGTPLRRAQLPEVDQ